ncbi:MAG: amylo-alpha-1,6-glucosidase, partial [Pedosphaera sp.]|nr:amylo-alpha-1,6-glucosidase [Pedosphaera sp.]
MIPKPMMSPQPGERWVRHVGDRLRFSVRSDFNGTGTDTKFFLRTNLGRAAVLRREIIESPGASHFLAGASWRDVPMHQRNSEWIVEFTLTEVGYFEAKIYSSDSRGWQTWAEGDNIGIAVHPNATRTANTIYCAFTRMFGPGKSAKNTERVHDSPDITRLEKAGYSVIPPSGTFRDLARELPHIFGALGCRILHLLPVNPAPTVYARMGRFGSPYACGDLTAVDPALVEFDQRTTGVQQFCELTDAVHRHAGWLFLDLTINHTGWGSTLQENHPDWFKREADGKFASPGAWGNTWADLVELEPHHRALWEHLADAFLTWCRRGVDGFRCDAGYKVPMPVWRYIVARVRCEFPDTVFFLEGLGGGWDDTENLLTHGGMQWAYSELFQEYNGPQIAAYLDHANKQSQRAGVLVHYSETHDNPRLSSKGRAWSLLRNRLCALTSVNGAYGFACGMEWMAPERINVHSARGLAWGNSDNLLPELLQLNSLLAQHPFFFDGARLTRLSSPDCPVYALLRESLQGDAVLVVVNTDCEAIREVTLPSTALSSLGTATEVWTDLLGQALPQIKRAPSGTIQIQLPPGAAFCFSNPDSHEKSGDDYRADRARAAWAVQCLATVLKPEEIGPFDWRELAHFAAVDPAGFLTAVQRINPAQSANDLCAALNAATSPGHYAPVISWRLADCRRVLMVPPVHWLLLQLPDPFRVTLESEAGQHLKHAQSVPANEFHVAAFPPDSAHFARLIVSGIGDDLATHIGVIQFLGTHPMPAPDLAAQARAETGFNAPLVLLTNQRGGMARICIDLGRVKSKYDCLLAANLHPALPVDRHVLAKRVRLWANADGFISPLDAANLLSFVPGPPASWHFLASAGDGRAVILRITIGMVADENTVWLEIDRLAEPPSRGVPLPADKIFSLTARVDIEDRNFHSETKHDSTTDQHFAAHTHTLAAAPGFEFRPAENRRLKVTVDAGLFHPQSEWSHAIPHSVEASRAQTDSGDAYSPGWFEIPLAPGQSARLCLTAEPQTDLPIACATASGTAQTFATRLHSAVDAFLVRRDSGKTVIAGYPWFLDWGRDSLIAARGLIAAGRHEEVRQILVQFAALEKDGTLPNTLNGDDTSNRDTSDAPLWFALVCDELAAVLGASFYSQPIDTVGRTIAEVLESIAVNYRRGTPNGIRMDAASGLIWSPAHFTWMDTNHPACSPREGYPVEIQALWIHLLRQMTRLHPDSDWNTLATLADQSFSRYFVLRDGKIVADLLIGTSGTPAAEAIPDDLLRPNALFAVTLGLLSGETARALVAAASQHLLIPGA